MSKMIQIRDVPDGVHRTLKARAAREGMSLSDFLKRELERTVKRPTMTEWLETVRHLKPISSKQNAAAIVRELRDSR
jgi:plasmid stability protein